MLKIYEQTNSTQKLGLSENLKLDPLESACCNFLPCRKQQHQQQQNQWHRLYALMNPDVSIILSKTSRYVVIFCLFVLLCRFVLTSLDFVYLLTKIYNLLYV